MNISELKETLKKMIDKTNDEQLLTHWKSHLEKEYQQYQHSSGPFSTNEQETGKDKGKDDTSGYVILESGLGIDE